MDSRQRHQGITDYRLNEHRREVFLDFYEYHLRNRGHAGAVYYAFPYLFKRLNMTREQKLWFVFINGCSQNVVTTYLLFKRFPDLNENTLKGIRQYFRENYALFGWDTDRRYVKNKFEECIVSYIENLAGRSQEEYFDSIANSDDKYENFRNLWEVVMRDFKYFGRLATFSYLEYLRIAGIHLDCDRLFLEDITGSKSHRNGLCKVLGRDDLDWHGDVTPEYTEDMIEWLTKEGEQLIEEARQRTDHEDVSYFTLETTLCCYKGWHRVNRRYPNVYNDMFYDRIRYAELKWGYEEDFTIFWDARKEYLPKHLRLEDNLLDRGLCKEKQNHYRLTGEVIMMEDEGYEVNKKTWMRSSILLVGMCGVGKTWVMKSLIASRDSWAARKIGKVLFLETDDLIIVGKYDNTTFEGSDRLSMSVMTDVPKMLKYIEQQNKMAVFEGDRFTNSKFIALADPCIVKILGDGAQGREARGSQQSERHLKSIATRVGNIQEHKAVKNSTEALELVKSLINEKS